MQFILLAGWVALHAWLADLARLHGSARMIIHIACAIGAVVTWGVLALSWGGDLMRPHLRKVSPIARSACPGCGHQLTSHLAGDEPMIRCPECGSDNVAKAGTSLTRKGKRQRWQYNACARKFIPSEEDVE